MQKMGITFVLFILAIGISLGVSFFLWGGPVSLNNGSDASTEIAALKARIDSLETEILKINASEPEHNITYEDFEILLNRLNSLDESVKKLSSKRLVSIGGSGPEAKNELTVVAEQKAREVYENMKEEERRKQEEEWRRRREERERQTEEWLSNVYNDRLALFSRELSLTPTQEISVKSALDVRKDMIIKMYSGRGLSDEERRQQGIPSMDEITETFDTSMQQILNQQQFQAYKEKHLDNFNRRGRRNRSRD